MWLTEVSEDYVMAWARQHLIAPGENHRVEGALHALTGESQGIPLLRWSLNLDCPLCVTEEIDILSIQPVAMEHEPTGQERGFLRMYSFCRVFLSVILQMPDPWGGFPYTGPPLMHGPWHGVLPLGRRRGIALNRLRFGHLTVLPYVTLQVLAATQLPTPLIVHAKPGIPNPLVSKSSSPARHQEQQGHPRGCCKVRAPSRP